MTVLEKEFFTVVNKDKIILDFEWVLNSVTAVFIRGGRTQVEGHVKMEAKFKVIFLHAIKYQGLSEAAKDKERIFFRSFRERMSLPISYFSPMASLIVREQISVFSSHPVCGDLLWQA